LISDYSRYERHFRTDGVVPDPTAVEWIDKQPSESVWTTSITIFELQFGLELLPDSRKRRALTIQLRRLIEEDLENRIIDFDTAAAVAAGSLAARRQLEGKSQDTHDTQIAGIVLSRRATLATRNVRHFADIKSAIINPWTD
jgi:predicted nucleic acid-binding protein